MLQGQARLQFEDLHSSGMRAKDKGDHTEALELFAEAGQLARQHHDDPKLLDALQPEARAFWSLERYDEATQTLEQARQLAFTLELPEQLGIVYSNLGRLAATRVIHTTDLSPTEQIQALQQDAIPHFRRAYTILRDTDHLYFRYANAQHGAVIAALTCQRRFTRQLLIEGMRVAFRQPSDPHELRRPYRVNPYGLVDFIGATMLLPFGNQTPVVAAVARKKLIR